MISLFWFWECMDIRMLSTRPRPMLRMPRPMRAVHGRCGQSTADVGWPLCAVQGRCGQATSDVGCPLCAVHGRCGRATPDVHRPFWASEGRCGKATPNVGWAMRASEGRCGKATADVDWAMGGRHGRCGQATADVDWALCASEGRCGKVTLDVTSTKGGRSTAKVGRAMRTGHGPRGTPCPRIIMNVYNPNVHGLRYKHTLASTNEFYIYKNIVFNNLFSFLFFS